MIVDRLDLDAAITEGIISRDQALQLRDLSNRGRSAEDAPIDFSQDTRDEPFRLLRGFRDFFIAVGVVIFAVGLTAISLRFIGEISFVRGGTLRVGDGSGWAILVALALCLFGLAQAEIITRRQRLPLSSLVVSIAFASWSALMLALVAANLVLATTQNAAEAFRAARWLVGWSAITGAILGVAFFYWRYRLPFALLLLAGSLVGLSLLIVRNLMGADWFGTHDRILIGLWGCAIFIAAMWFDMKDRLRVTRLSECAFWLHLFAAPLLVHAVLFGGPVGTPDQAFILGTMALLSIIALLIDRRALLVSALSYFAVAISQLVSSSTLFGTFASTAIILGGVILTLGLCWTPIRRTILALIPFDPLKSRLPPAAA